MGLERLSNIKIPPQSVLNNPIKNQQIWFLGGPSGGQSVRPLPPLKKMNGGQWGKNECIVAPPPMGL